MNIMRGNPKHNMKRIIMALAVMAFTFSPLVVAEAEAGQGKHANHSHHGHHRGHSGRHKTHHQTS
jgi:Ni/Co efflux regulator RcnB